MLMSISYQMAERLPGMAQVIDYQQQRALQAESRSCYLLTLSSFAAAASLCLGGVWC